MKLGRTEIFQRKEAFLSVGIATDSVIYFGLVCHATRVLVDVSADDILLGCPSGSSAADSKHPENPPEYTVGKLWPLLSATMHRWQRRGNLFAYRKSNSGVIGEFD